MIHNSWLCVAPMSAASACWATLSPDDEAITLFDGTGVGLQDLAVAAAAADAAAKKGLAVEIEV